MPYSKNDNYYFKDFERLYFGDETENRAAMYHDGSGMVFENISISGTEGPPGPAGAGIAGSIIETEDGSAGVKVTETGFIDLWTENVARMLISDQTVTIGTAPSYSHNWGDLMIKVEANESTNPTNTLHHGLKIATFGAYASNSVEFLKSNGPSTAPTPSVTGESLGTINWSSFNTNNTNYNAYARIDAVDLEATTDTVDDHKVELKFQTRYSPHDVWKTQLIIGNGDDSGISLNKGTIISGFFDSVYDMEAASTNKYRSVLTVAGTQSELTSLRNEFTDLVATVSGAKYFEIYDSTISGARVDCAVFDGYKPSINFSIDNNEIARIDSYGKFHLGLQYQHTDADLTSVQAIRNDDTLNDSMYTGETLSTTYAIKRYIDKFISEGENSRLVSDNVVDKSILDLKDDELAISFGTTPLNFNFKYSVGSMSSDLIHPRPATSESYFGEAWTLMAGTKCVFGSYAPGDSPIWNQPDIGMCTYWYGGTKGHADFNLISPQWGYRRVLVSQKNSLSIADPGGSSIGILAWDSDSLYEESTWKRHGLSFQRISGTPDAPTHVIGGELLGRLSWDYCSEDGLGVLDRAGWIEMKLGSKNAYVDGSSYLDWGATVAERSTWFKLENEMLLAASVFGNFGKIRLRSKLYFDDGSENFVSGIIQSENTAIQGSSGGLITDPWRDNTASRFVWGMDHVLPSAQWVLDQIDTAVTLEAPTYSAISSLGAAEDSVYSAWNSHVAGIGRAGFRVSTGYDAGSYVFAISGSPGHLQETLGRQSWAMRLSCQDDKTRFFIENYAPKQADSSGHAYTGELNFFRARGGSGMATVKWPYSTLTNQIIAKDNGQVFEHDIIGRIQAYGHAYANAIDKDPCTSWVYWKPAAQIDFVVENAELDKIEAGIYFKTRGTLPTYSEKGVSAVIDYKGYTHFGNSFVTGSNPATSVPYNMGKYITDRRRKGVVSIDGGGIPTFSTQDGQSTLALWNTYPSLTFSSNSGEDGPSWQVNHYFNARIIHWREGSYYRNKALGAFGIPSIYKRGGLSTMMMDTTTWYETEAMLITDQRDVIIGGGNDAFETAYGQRQGHLVVCPTVNGADYGITLRSAYSNRSLRIFFTGNAVNWWESVRINTGETGDDDLYINEGTGSVLLGRLGNTIDLTKSKLIINGHTTPAQDNLYNLGLADYRFNDIWATNGTIQVSDRRDKTDIQDESLGLDFIKALRPVSFKRVNGTRKHRGLIAQELEKVFKDMGKDGNFFAGLIHDAKADKYGIRYEELIAPLIKAVQEQSIIIDKLVAKLEEK